MPKNINRWAPLIIIASLMVAAFFSGIHEHVSIEKIKENKELLHETVKSRPLLSSLGFIGIYILAVSLSLPIASVLTLTGGFLFGKWLGTLYVVTGASIGAGIIFLASKSSLGETLREKAGPLYQKIEKNMKENAAGYLLFMRLVPLFPFFLVNIVPALFNVKLSTFMLTTFFGIMPGSFVYVNLGEKLAEIDNFKDLISTETLLAFSLLGVFALVPTLYKKFKSNTDNT